MAIYGYFLLGNWYWCRLTATALVRRSRTARSHAVWSTTLQQMYGRDQWLLHAMQAQHAILRSTDEASMVYIWGFLCQWMIIKHSLDVIACTARLVWRWYRPMLQHTWLTAGTNEPVSLQVDELAALLLLYVYIYASTSGHSARNWLLSTMS